MTSDLPQQAKQSAALMGMREPPPAPAGPAGAQAPAEPGEPQATVASGQSVVSSLAPLRSRPDRRCANCGAPVPGRFCGECGQRLEHSVHSIWHFAREAFEDLTHADSRIWRTFVALLFRPGLLTLQYLAGRRASYLPPLRLYLVLSVVFFLVASTGSPDTGQPAGARSPTAATFQGEPKCETSYTGPWHDRLQNLLDTGCRKFRQDQGHSLGAAFLHNLPRAMFLFLPLLAFVMSAMYWRPRRFYVEHLLFLLHDQAFVFLWFGLLWLLSQPLPESVADALTSLGFLYIPFYLFRSMRQVYAQGRMLTFLKFTLLAIAYFVAGMLMLALTMAYSVMTA